MKVRAICLEVFAELSDKEFEKLKKLGVLNGMLMFSNNVTGEADYNIPIDIRLIKKQKEELVVEQNPRKVYFGKANNISFRINQGFYDAVERKRMHGDRFYGSEGKLIMTLKDR